MLGINNMSEVHGIKPPSTRFLNCRRLRYLHMHLPQEFCMRIYRLYAGGSYFIKNSREILLYV